MKTLRACLYAELVAVIPAGYIHLTGPREFAHGDKAGAFVLKLAVIPINV